MITHLVPEIKFLFCLHVLINIVFSFTWAGGAPIIKSPVCYQPHIIYRVQNLCPPPYLATSYGKMALNPSLAYMPVKEHRKPCTSLS